jgi:DNA repair exonuclease SbcCD nuclease subunit
MTYIISSDWHCHNWSQFSTTVDGINSRLTDILHEIERQAIDANACGAKNIYVAGDVFHVRGSIKPTVFNPVVDMLAKCVVKYGVEFRVMPGNHDLEGRDSERLSSAITQLGQINGVHVCSETQVFWDDKVAMIPWHDARDTLSYAVELLREQNEGINPDEWDLILHTGINGVLIGMPDHGWSPEELAEFGFKRVFCGHYHNHKVFECDDQQIVSIGALTHQTWSDTDTRAGYIVVDDIAFSHVSTEAPCFIDFDLDEAEEIYKGNFVRVRGIELDEADKRQMRDALEAAGALGVVIDPLSKPEVTRTVSKGETHKKIRLESQITDYAKEMYGDLADDIGKEALDVLKEVEVAA